MIDLHCHILPYVDDGAEDFDEALELLRMMSAQKITEVCATPHLRAHMFGTPDEEIQKRFAELELRAKGARIPVKLHLSREYHCDKDFFRLLRSHRLIAMGPGKTLLCEFSGASEAGFIEDAIRDVLSEGYIPLVAHAERYRAVRSSEELLRKLKNLGAYIQVNAGSLLGDEGLGIRHFCRKLAKEHLIDVIATDSHDPVSRPPKMESCRAWLNAKTDRAYAEMITNKIPFELLNGI